MYCTFSIEKTFLINLGILKLKQQIIPTWHFEKHPQYHMQSLKYDDAEDFLIWPQTLFHNIVLCTDTGIPSYSVFTDTVHIRVRREAWDRKWKEAMLSMPHLHLQEPESDLSLNTAFPPHPGFLPLLWNSPTYNFSTSWKPTEFESLLYKNLGSQNMQSWWQCLWVAWIMVQDVRFPGCSQPVVKLCVTSQRHYLRTDTDLQRAQAGRQCPGEGQNPQGRGLDHSHIGDVKWVPFPNLSQSLPRTLGLHFTWFCEACTPIYKMWITMVTFLELLWRVKELII